jgi:hypothetical protein
LQSAIEKLERLIEGLVQTHSRIRWKHAVCHSDKQRIAEALSQSPQSVANGRLGKAEAIACCRKAAKVPNCEKYPQ